MGRNYKGYIKYAAGTGAVAGTAFSTAHMLDIKEERKLSHKEMIAYPVGGAITGAALITMSPVIIVFSPVVYLFGDEAAGALAKIILGGILLSDDKE